ncbi:hypothetical protein [Chitinophaga pinensis]|uniref:Uncharacterized protein n=1 Tax=Chitinophaga pinensis TaxID=79329 RepID=A0A5C6LNF0_9BACT|nr:hypothetical protein [Chitinophaga pinensis]TWV90758.1 hypothetical protein FEF09_29285 [Chitinophaga pinensis]
MSEANLNLTEVPAAIDQQVALLPEEYYQSMYLMLDIVYDILIQKGDDSFLGKLKAQYPKAAAGINALIAIPAADKSFQVWYNNDNLYQRYKDTSLGELKSASIQALHKNIKGYMDAELGALFSKDSLLGKLLQDSIMGQLQMSTIDKKQVLALFDILDYIISKFQSTTRNLTLLSTITKMVKEQLVLNEVSTDDGKTVIKSVSLNFESLILALNNAYNNPNRKPWSIPTWTWGNFIKPRFFLKMGVNSGRFLASNTLTKDSANRAVRLSRCITPARKSDCSSILWIGGIRIHLSMESLFSIMVIMSDGNVLSPIQPFTGSTLKSMLPASCTTSLI